MESSNESRTSTHLAAMVLLSAIFSLMTWISWRKWPDFIMDYGLSLYIPWRLSEGEILYRDFYFLYGPLSQYLHALMFQVFGTGFSTLFSFNLLLAAGFTLLIYCLMTRLADAITGLFCGLTFLLVFCFYQHLGAGSFNYIAPYQYENCHGLYLSFFALFLFLKNLHSPGLGKIAALGLLTGLVFLTKVEVFIAIIFALIPGIFLTFRILPEITFSRSLAWTLFVLSALLPAMVFCIVFSFYVPIGKAFNYLVTPYIYVFNSPVPSLPLYKWIIGLDHLPENILRIAIHLAGYALVFLFGFGINHLFREQQKKLDWALILSLFIMALAAILYFRKIPWLSLVGGLQLFLAGYLIVYFKLAIQKARQGISCHKELGNLVFGLFALGLLPKMIFNLHIHLFGFVILLPATLVMVKVLAHDLPQLARKHSSTDRFTKGFSYSLVTIIIAAIGLLNAEGYWMKTHSLEQGKDRVYDFHPKIHPRGQMVEEVLSYMRVHVQPGEQVATLPTGIMFNYLLRAPTPASMFALIPFDDPILGEHALRDSLTKSPPDWIILVEHRYMMMGKEYFGEDYGVSAYQWIQNNYQPVLNVGATPYIKRGFGIQVLKPKADINR